MQILNFKSANIAPWIIVQGIGFQLFWFVCVIGQNQWLLLSTGLLCLHFIFTPQRNSDLKLLLLALVGITVDSSLTLLNVFQFSSTPYWLGLLWLGFIVSLAHSLKWLAKQPLLVQTIFGCIAGCISYLTGEKFGAVNFGINYTATVLILLLIWACLLPTLFKCLQRWEKHP